MSLLDIKLIASAVRVGEESAKMGEVSNPFTRVNKLLRMSFDFGWSVQQPTRERFYSLESLVSLAAAQFGPRSLTNPSSGDIKLIASAVRAGEGTAQNGEIGNPFDRLNEPLRQAFDFGSSSTSAPGYSFYSAEILVSLTAPTRRRRRRNGGAPEHTRTDPDGEFAEDVPFPAPPPLDPVKPIALQAIKQIASAVRAGEERAKTGQVSNPFDGLNPLLRSAFHFGWCVQQPGGERFYSVETLLLLVAQEKGPICHPQPSSQDIKLIASAVRAGEETAENGDIGNPFDRLNEPLRLAFHFGWSATLPMGDTFYSVEILLGLASGESGKILLPARHFDRQRTGHRGEFAEDVSFREVPR